MNRSLADMRNLGPATARMLIEVEIADEDTLHAVGAIEAWHRLRFRFGGHVTIIALYAMEAALRGCDWRKLDATTKARLSGRGRKAGQRRSFRRTIADPPGGL